jgi:hypothetical protein
VTKPHITNKFLLDIMIRILQPLMKKMSQPKAV